MSDSPAAVRPPALNCSADQFGQLRFSHNGWGQLVVVAPDGMEFAGVEPIRCFPHTAPSISIALLDSHGRELLLLPSLDVLSAEARQVIERDLAEREFIPEIRRILSVSAPWPPCEVDVETDRGITRFAVDSEDDFRRLPNGAIIINDSHGVRYRISQSETLDTGSKRHLRRFL